MSTAPCTGKPGHTLCIAPMMGCTDRFDRYLLRLITPNSFLYTEMLTSKALLHGDRERLLRFDPLEHPVALQVGGSDPAEMARCAVLAERHGYDEVNINAGCPSPRVQSGRFGACLMREADLLARCVRAMAAAVAIPVTVKTRIGVDEHDRYEQLLGFVDALSAAGCETVIVHARKAWLKGLSPKQNREVPPLRHAVVHRLKQDRPGLEIIINGGIGSETSALAQLNKTDGVMIGRSAYRDPYWLAALDRGLFGECGQPVSRAAVVQAYLPYMEKELARGTPLTDMTRHLLGLFRGLPGGRGWRRDLSRCRGSSLGLTPVLEALQRLTVAESQLQGGFRTAAAGAEESFRSHGATAEAGGAVSCG